MTIELIIAELKEKIADIRRNKGIGGYRYFSKTIPFLFPAVKEIVNINGGGIFTRELRDLVVPAYLFEDQTECTQRGIIFTFPQDLHGAIKKEGIKYDLYKTNLREVMELLYPGESYHVSKIEGGPNLSSGLIYNDVTDLLENYVKNYFSTTKSQIREFSVKA